MRAVGEIGSTVEGVMAKHESVWITTSEPSRFAALQEAVDVDVVVVGAGIAGLSTALLLKYAGPRVACSRRGLCAAQRPDIRPRRSARSTG